MSDQANPPAQHDEPAEEHGIGAGLLVKVFLALMVLTVGTVTITFVDLGSLNVWAALLIAVAKASLVALYFMHLRHDSPFNGVILVTAMLFVVLFIGIAILDSREYAVNYQPPTGIPAAAPTR
jgi:cytochrome c oxidase subunit 4